MIVERPSAACVCIGDEILSGHTRDANLHYLGSWLNRQGVELAEARVVLDEKQAIIESVNSLRTRYNYVFTSGGIGATHDDITAVSVSAAFGRECVFDKRALAVLERSNKQSGRLSEARRLMARMPQGAELILGEQVGAPGFRVENVYVLAGVPSIFRAMLVSLDGSFNGQVWYSRSIQVHCGETTIAMPLEQVQQQQLQVKIGSYPMHTQEFGHYVQLVLRGSQRQHIDPAADQLLSMLTEMDITHHDLGYSEL